jgi:acetyl-CoA carboxylase alpha subunit
MTRILKEYIKDALSRFENATPEELKRQRAQKFEVMGFFETKA